MAGFRFGVFDIDIDSGELRKQGRIIKLQEKPLQTLRLLLERAGEVVTREELRERLWPSDTFVQFDDNLNSAIRRVREALGDSAENPRFLETIPRRGYRFLCPVEAIPRPAVSPTTEKQPFRILLRRGAAIAAIVVLCAAAGWRLRARSEAGAGKIMLAVAPFRNLSGAPEQDYVSDGVTEELIAQLGRLAPQRLGVIARSSVMRYKTKPQDIGAIARDLGVSYLLEGSIRKSADRINVTAQLVQASDRTHVWAETYEQPAANLFAIQRDIARKIAVSLAIQLLAAQEMALARASTTNTEAYDAYLAGRYEWNRGTRDSFEAALRSFQRAIELDGNYAMAHVGAARCYLALEDYRFLPRDEALRLARRESDAALRLDDSLPESHTLAADILPRSDANAPGIEEGYRKAIALNPSSAEGHRAYAFELLRRKRNDEAIAQISEAARLDPQSPAANTYAAWVLYSAGRYNPSREWTQRALALDPNFPFALYVRGRLDTQAGKLTDAVADFQKAATSSGRTPKYLFMLANAYLKVGNHRDAASLLEELREQSRLRYVPEDYIQSLSEKLKIR
jgi:TolB-like protein/DNA-binding winged helix-turn-helix (wHTH) protein/Tfp pilus assembly protein PilF